MSTPPRRPIREVAHIPGQGNVWPEGMSEPAGVSEALVVEEATASTMLDGETQSLVVEPEHQDPDALVEAEQDPTPTPRRKKETR